MRILTRKHTGARSRSITAAASVPSPSAASKSGTIQFSTTLTPGRNLPVRYRMRGHAIQFKLQNAQQGQSWAYEDGMAVLSPVGRQRATL